MPNFYVKILERSIFTVLLLAQVAVGVNDECSLSCDVIKFSTSFTDRRTAYSNMVC